MHKPIPTLKTTLLLCLALCASAASAAGEKDAQAAATEAAPGATINPRAIDRRQRELEAKSLKALVRQALATAGDIQSACPGGPRGPRLTLSGPGDPQGLSRATGPIGLRPGDIPSGNVACEPHWNHAMHSTAQALLAAGSWSARHPEFAKLLKITPESSSELKHLERGLALVMGAFGASAKP